MSAKRPPVPAAVTAPVAAGRPGGPPGPLSGAVRADDDDADAVTLLSRGT